MIVIDQSQIACLPIVQRCPGIFQASNDAPSRRQTRIFASLIQDTREAIQRCGYARVYFAVACEVFSEAIPDWLLQPGAGRPDIPVVDEGTCTRLCKGLMYDYLAAIDEFGYDAVYFGVGCEVFDKAVDPWEGNDY